MHRESEHSQPCRGNDVAGSTTESLYTEIHRLEGTREPHRDAKSSAPTNPYVPPRRYRSLLIMALCFVVAAIFLLLRWPFGGSSWEGRIQPAQSRLLNAPHAGRWTIDSAMRLGDRVQAETVLGKVENPELRQALAAKAIELQAAEAALESLRASTQRQKDAHAAAIVDHQRSEISRAELTDIEIALRDVSLRCALAEAARNALQGDLERLQKQTDRERICSPYEGTILVLNTRHDGSYVSAGEQLAEVGSPDVVLHFEVPETDVPNLKVGQRVTFTCAGSSKRRTGAIERVEPRLREEDRGPLRERMRYGLAVVIPREKLPDDARPGLLVKGRPIRW